MKAALDNSQIQCWHCEELVHRYAARCPYCHKDLVAHASKEPEPLVATGKIATFAPANLHPFEVKNEETKETEEATTFVAEAFIVLLSLAALLAGSFFFFFGILIKLFSSNGVFTLEWNQASWPYFVFSAVVLVIVGLAALSKIEK